MRQTQEWDAPGILAAIKRKGETLTGLARRAGLHDGACRTSLGRPFPAADTVISEFLGVPLNELWPNRYTADGSRIDRRTIRFRAQTKRNGGRTHGQNVAAA